jgi:DNA modification methylase
VYHEEKDIILLHGDCLEILPLFEPKSFDLVLTDPPYGIGEDGGRYRDRKGGGHRVLPKMNWDKKIPPLLAFELLLSRSKEQIIWGGNYFSNMLPNSRGWLYWDKKMGGDFSDGELAWTSRDAVLRSFSYCNKEHGKQHPTQKPINLMKWCIGFAPDAQTILDPFLGSGTTAVAAKQLGRKCVGIELEQKYLDIAIERLRQEQLF